MRQTGGSSLSPQHTDRPLHISRGGERGKVVEVSSKTRIVTLPRFRGVGKRGNLGQVRLIGDRSDIAQ